MIRAIHLVAVALAWGAFAHRLVSLRRGRRDGARRALCLALLFLALAITVSLPPVYERIPGLAEVPGLVRMVQHGLAMLAALWAQVLLVHLVGPPGRTGRAVGVRVAVTAAALAAMIALFLLADPVGHVDDFVQENAALPFVSEYLLVFLGYLSVVAIDFVRLLSTYSRRTGERHLRIALRLWLFANVAGLGYAVHKAGYTLVRRFGEMLPWSEGPVSTALVGPPVALFVAGLTATAWRRWIRGLRTYRAYVALLPLWHAFHAAMPELALLPATAHRALSGSLRTLNLRFCRCVIEIMDGRLALRARLDERVARLARRRGIEDGLPGTELAAVVEAATLAAALRAGRPDGPAEPVVAPEAPAGDEIRHLVRVARAFRRSPVVAAVLVEVSVSRPGAAVAPRARAPER